MILACPRRPELHPRRLFLFLRPLFVLLALGLSLPAGPPAAAETASPPAERVLVTDVIDGDTVKVVRGRRQETVRLIGVDTPETGRPDTPVQFHGPEAALFTRRSLIGKRVRLEFEPPDRLGGSADKYHRTLAYIFTDEGMNFNLELVRLGHGRTYTKYPFRYQREFSKDALLRITSTAWRLLDEVPPERRENWLADLRSFWGDVQPGDNVTTVVVPGGATRFYDARGFMGQIEDPEFGPAFLSIWLDSRSVVGDLRVKLLGLDRTTARR